MSEVKLNVILLNYTESPEKVVAMAGRLCYSPAEIGGLKDEVAGREERFVEKLMDMGHLSPIEHASFTFGIEGVSRALLAQITRHRLASFSVQSQRYVDQGQKDGTFKYIVPASIRALGDEAVNRYVMQMEVIAGYYKEWVDLGIPGEDARFVLPNAAETRMILTMNARELLHFFRLRCCNRAQWEIRELAWRMLALVREAAPGIFGSAGPSCVSCGTCSEGRMSCGKADEVKKRAAELGL